MVLVLVLKIVELVLKNEEEPAKEVLAVLERRMKQGLAILNRVDPVI